MRGQLWEECYCGTEPVCAMCQKCQKHCSCGKAVERHSNECAEPYRLGIGQGFCSTEDGDF